MAVGMKVDQTVPGSVKKDLLPSPFSVVYLICEKIHHEAKPVACKGILRHPVKLGISFKHMKQRVHRLLCQHTVFGEFLIALRLKIPGEGFQIAICIGHFFLDQKLKASGNIQSILTAGGIIIRR